VIIDDFDVERTGLRPAKADSPLIVDPDAVLTGSSAFQGFESIARWYFQIVQAGGDLELPQLASRDPSMFTNRLTRTPFESVLVSGHLKDRIMQNSNAMRE
jgi:hypothetical protein